MRVLTVIGNRPQFIKAAAVSPRLRAGGAGAGAVGGAGTGAVGGAGAVGDAELLVHTGQHHDDRLSTVFFAELGLPAPDRQLGIAGGSNTSQTARMLAALEPVMSELPAPDWVLVYGDTNSTLAGALVAAQLGLPVAHVEAGMRSFDRAMPEEINRVTCDHLSTLLLCPSELAAENLRREGIGGAIEVVGDVMVDVALEVQPRARVRLDLVRACGAEPGAYLLATAHRAANVDDRARLALLVELLVGLGEPVVLPLHPRTRARLDDAGLLVKLDRSGTVTILEPVGYFEMAALLCNARALVTDSGGLQKEAYLAGVPCVTLRDRTEWVETVQLGWNTLVDLDLSRARVALASPPPVDRPQLYGDGQAGERVVAALRRIAGAG